MPRAVGTPGHRKKATREEDLARVAKLDRRGYSQADIARVIGVSQPQICEDLKKIREHYRAAANATYAEKVEEKRAQLREVRSQAWKAWEKSKKDGTRWAEEVTTGASGDRTKTTEAKEGRLPDATYLRVVIETLRDECALDGLNQPQKLNINANVIDWGELFRRTMDDEVNQVERRLAEIQAELENPASANATQPGQLPGPGVQGG
jgi:predicted transcriptional regulator